MSETPSPALSSAWRTAKACQECRKRKIKCNGVEPCKTCQLRNTPCIYRDIVRQRKRKQRDRPSNNEETPQSIEAPRPQSSARQQSPELPHKPSGKYTFYNSVSATHMASPSCKVRLYYGPTAHFALMQQVYRDLMSNQAAQAEEPQGEVEEAGAGLDLFSFRRIFFGTPSEAPDLGKSANMSGLPTTTFLSYGLADTFLQRFLSTLFALIPVRSQGFFQQQLNQLYQPSLGMEPDTAYHALVLLALAMGSLGTEHYAWGDVLFERAKASSATLDEVHAHYQMEQGRPNSAFIHLGIGARKAIAAGLHKEVPSQDGETSESIEERRATFWYFYFYETWICFHLGRPSSLSLRDVTVRYPKDSFLLVLLHLAKAISRSADEIYGQRHESLLQMWKIAKSISNDLHGHDCLMKQALGFGLDKPPQHGVLGVRQTVLVTLYYHTILLTYRPFLIFRGRWQRDMKRSAQDPGSNAAKRPTEIPAWLNEACANVLNCASATIHHLCGAACVNELVKELRYHGFFIGSSSFALFYNLMHDESVASSHLPWIHAGIWYLSTVRPGDPIESSISAMQTMLKKLHPSYEWIPPERTRQIHGAENTSSFATRPFSSEAPGPQEVPMDLNPPGEQLPEAGFPVLPDLQTDILPGGMKVPSVGSGEDLLDLTQSDMGWDFDFSTMDLEEIFSVYPGTGPPAI
ncbi:hypothetical protein SI65_08841 [Aspergillus cristatus]|uniref:Zn(2)-C6 fungal-type domain-containing protein n=1 Tax=Aspergillus cristatus TaxID=573508 RepID=A0A1E3B3T7_ASPCR|nr:hypothetical protein SI65_08841 [Aspergillus cristatus]